MAELTNGAAVLHVRFEGRSADIPVSDLDVGPNSSDGDVKQAVARYLDVSADKFRHYVVDRHETGNLTIRPEAVFG
jgi:hypothetical protein